ncbi:MAG: prenyltransferase/squalene oxidase repeat-containing protein, partial [Planctomycetota bacterium]
DDRPARRVADAELQPAIHRAIDRGIGYLQRIQNPSGSWTVLDEEEQPGRRWNPTFNTGGYTALALYALAASGVPAADPAIRRGLEWVRTHPKAFAVSNATATYTNSILVLALTRIDARGLRKLIHGYADTVVSGQRRDGMWSYPLGSRTTPTRRPSVHGRGDNSNTQFAVLALWAAHSLADHRVPGRIWKKVTRHYETTQAERGGWGYQASSRRPTATMTAAGLVSLVYARAALDPKPEALANARRSSRVRRGLGALDVLARPASLLGNVYWLYSLERVGTVLARKDDSWYVTGARHLVETQDERGAWGHSVGVQGPGRHGSRPAPEGEPKPPRRVYETAFALLFLSRSTLPPRKGVVTAPDRTRRPAAKTARDPFPDLIDPSPGGEQRLLRAFQIYTLSSDRRRAALAPLFAVVGPRIVRFSLDRLQDDRLYVRRAALDLLERILRRRFPFDPAAPEAQRGVMLGPLERFWKEHGGRLRWDAEQSRFIVGS